MIETITRIVPRGLLVGLAAYLMAVFIWFQPMVEVRLADRVYLPACERTLVAAASDSADRAMQDHRRTTEILGPWTDLTTEYLNELGAAMGQPGLGEIYSDIQAPVVPDMNAVRALANTTCGCAVTVAYGDARWEMFAHVASARAYRPSVIDAIGKKAAAIAASGECGTH